METSAAITKLCEAWWERLSDSTRSDQQAYAREFLGLLGWSELTVIDTGARETPLSSASFILRGGGESSIAAHFTMPGMLDPPSSLVERGLDCCEPTRLLVNGTRKLNVHYAYITDMFRSYLYDVETDELLLHADTPEVFNRDIAPVLQHPHVQRGSLEEIRRQPRSYSARQLREWCRHWMEAIAAHSGLTEADGALVIDRLLVLRGLFDHDIIKRSDWRLRKRFSDVVHRAFQPQAAGCGEALVSLFHDIWFDWKAELFRPVAALDDVLRKDAVSGNMIKEFTLLSKTKFTIATVLESFNYGDAAEKARVRLVPEADEERQIYLNRQTLATIDSARIEVDILDEGYRALMYWFDKVVAVYDRLGVQFDSEAYRSRAAGPDLDLFAWGELDANRPGALNDKFQHVITHGLTVYYASPRQYRTARLILYLHTIAAYREYKQVFHRFPPIESALKERPKVLQSDRNRIYQAAPRNARDDDF